MVTVDAARETVVAEWERLHDWVAGLPDDVLARPSVLDAWTVADLVAHLGRGISALVGVPLADPGVPGLPIVEYVSRYPAAAAEIAEQTRQLAVDSAGDLLGGAQRQVTEALAALDELAVNGDPVVIARRGPILLSDLVVTRTLELVVHADDLRRSAPDVAGFEDDPAALRLVTRVLATAVAEKAPGRTVELRVPPFAAVQLVEGPRHTRGTPPNVIETTPLTWIRVAAGRWTWDEALVDGSLRASGQRADLSAYLPLF